MQSRKKSEKLEIIAGHLNSLVKFLDDSNGIRVKLETKNVARKFNIMEKKLDRVEENLDRLSETRKKLFWARRKMHENPVLSNMTTNDHIDLNKRLPFDEDQQVLEYIGDVEKRVKLEHLLLTNCKVDERFVTRCARQLFSIQYLSEHLWRSGSSRDELKERMTGRTLVPPEVVEWFLLFIHSQLDKQDFFKPENLKHQLCSVFSKVPDVEFRNGKRRKYEAFDNEVLKNRRLESEEQA